MEDNRKLVEEQIIESYKREEEMMILVFAQWCVNQGLDPHALYLQAYPQQEGNEALRHALSSRFLRRKQGTFLMIQSWVCFRYLEMTTWHKS